MLAASRRPLRSARSTDAVAEFDASKRRERNAARTDVEDQQLGEETAPVIDYLDAISGPWDWKTASRQYTPYQKKRWAVQPTVYCWALRHRGFTNVEAIDTSEAPLDRFHFCVLTPDSDPTEMVTVDRDDEWDRWVLEQVLILVPLLEAVATVWPKRDNHDMCGPKWFEAFR